MGKNKDRIADLEEDVETMHTFVVELLSRVAALENLAPETPMEAYATERWDIITNREDMDRTFKNIEAEREEAEAMDDSSRYNGQSVIDTSEIVQGVVAYSATLTQMLEDAMEVAENEKARADRLQALLDAGTPLQMSGAKFSEAAERTNGNAMVNEGGGSWDFEEEGV